MEDVAPLTGRSESRQFRIYAYDATRQRVIIGTRTTHGAAERCAEHLTHEISTAHHEGRTFHRGESAVLPYVKVVVVDPDGIKVSECPVDAMAEEKPRKWWVRFERSITC